MKRSMEPAKPNSARSSIASYFSPSKAKVIASPTAGHEEAITDDPLDGLGGLLKGTEPSKQGSKKRQGQTTITPLSPAKKSKRIADDKGQWSLDVGQKSATQCMDCGMLFSNSSDEDRESHRLFHRMRTSTLKLKISAKMNVVYTHPSDPKRQVVLLSKEDLKKVSIQTLLELVDNELHFNSNGNQVNPKELVYVYAVAGSAAGVIRSEKIEKACRLLEIPLEASPSSFSGDSLLDTSISSTVTTQSASSASSSVVVCSKSPESAALGISRIWVRDDYKRQGIASILFDIARSNFTFGSIIAKTRCAITQPTVEGRLFAAAYFGMSNFLVYEN